MHSLSAVGEGAMGAATPQPPPLLPPSVTGGDGNGGPAAMRTRRAGARRGGGRSGSEAIELTHDAQTYGFPREDWNTATKSMWLLYIIEKQATRQEASAPVIAETFNKTSGGSRPSAPISSRGTSRTCRRGTERSPTTLTKAPDLVPARQREEGSRGKDQRSYGFRPAHAVKLAAFTEAADFANLSELEKSIHLAFFYLKTAAVHEFSGADCAGWIHERGFSRPNVTRLGDRLNDSGDTIRGQRAGHFRLHSTRLKELEQKFATLLEKPQTIQDHGTVLPPVLYENTRGYIESLAKQINRSYEENIFDGAAVLMRRLEEVLLILAYST